MARVSVVMPTYNRREMLPGLLTPLLTDAAVHEVVVVVDGCRDGSIELLQAMQRDDPRIVPVFIENQGETGARLTGARAATGDVVLLLDDDVEAGRGLVSAHARHHEATHDVVVVGYMPVRDRSSPTARLYGDSYERHTSRWRGQTQDVMTTLWAGNISLRRDTYLRLLSEPFQFRYDFHADRAFGFRCAAAGLRAVFDPECVATHHYTRSLAGLARDARNQGFGLVLLQVEFPEFSLPFDRDEFTRYAPDWVKPLVEACRRPRIGPIVSGAIRVATQLAERLGLPLADRGADLMATIERQRGAISAVRELTS